MTQSRNVPADEAFSIDGPAGQIEGVLFDPRRHAPINAVAVVCHPHPLHDGSMTNKVTHTLARTLFNLGIPAFRFNFRGVGNSEGTHDFGHGEVDDALAVIGYAARRFPGRELWLAGFSFGAYIALKVSQRVQTGHLITVAPPVQYDDFDDITPPDCPWLLIQGDNDDVVSCTDVLAWANTQRPMPDIVCLHEVGHFFHRRLGDLREAIENHLFSERPALRVAQG